MALSGIQLSAGIVVGSNKAVDAKYGPYPDLATAKSDIGSSLRFLGLTVGIETNGTVEEYWWESGTTDNDLVAKGGGGGGTWGSITGTLSNQTDLQGELDGKVDENAAITGATKTKITFDSKGLVTAGEDITAGDLPSAIDATKIADGSVTNSEFQHIGGLTSDAQTQIDGKQDTITGAATTITSSDLTASRAVTSSATGKIEVSSVTSTELGYVSGVTSDIQTQIDGKQATITGAATTIDDADLTASRALVSDGSGKVAVSDVTSTELGYLDGVTSAVQTQVDAKTPKLISLNTQTGTTYTFVLSDADKIIEMNNASANTVTVPLNSSVAFDIGTQILIVQKGAGTTTIAAAAGVTLLSKDSNLDIGGQYGAATCIKIATDTWYVIGDLA